MLIRNYVVIQVRGIEALILIGNRLVIEIHFYHPGLLPLDAIRTSRKIHPRLRIHEGAVVLNLAMHQIYAGVVVLNLCKITNGRRMLYLFYP